MDVGNCFGDIIREEGIEFYQPLSTFPIKIGI